MSKRIIAISNIHGYYDEMIALLDYIKYSPKNDKLFILGGLIDYGPKSMEVVEKCMELQEQGAVVLRGEREQMYINTFAYNHFPSEEKLCTTKNTLVYFYHDHPKIKERHIEFFISLPFYVEYENFVFSHAGVDLYYEDNYAYCLGNENFYLTDEEEIRKTGKTFVFGYHPVFNINPEHKSDLFVKSNMIGIDFGAGRSPIGTLGIVILSPDRKYYTIKIMI